MLFTEARFFAFFALVLGVHWALRGHRARKFWLLAASYAFYAGWDFRFLSLILTSTCIDYVVGVQLDRTADPKARKRWLRLSLAGNLGMLGAFKYFGFFVESAVDFAQLLGMHVSQPTLNIILPVGISFYTFQTMSYTIDVYRRNLRPVTDFPDFALFVAFFPQLVAGPIVRAIDFLPQLTKKRVFARDVAVRASLSLFLWGFVKKACVADNVSEIVDRLFANPEAFSASGTWISVALYHVQVYCDFSGYSDMAIATAGLLGYRLTENFDFPHFAPSIGLFWRRWHISLTSWVKDYVYVPLGGGRVGWARRIRNVYVVILSVAVWHGAGWHYILFGFMHATMVSVCHWWRHSRLRAGILGRVIVPISWPLTTFFLLAGWPMFRAGTVAESAPIYRTMFGLEPGGARGVDPAWAWFVLAATVVHFAFYKRFLFKRFAALPHWAFSIVYGGAWALVLPWVATGYKPFIYFQF